MRLFNNAEADILGTAEERRGRGWGRGERQPSTYRIIDLQPQTAMSAGGPEGQGTTARSVWDLLACSSGYIADPLDVM